MCELINLKTCEQSFTRTTFITPQKTSKPQKQILPLGLFAVILVSLILNTTYVFLCESKIQQQQHRHFDDDDIDNMTQQIMIITAMTKLTMTMMTTTRTTGIKVTKTALKRINTNVLDIL